MDLSSYADSRAFFEFPGECFDPEMADFQSIKGRAHCVAALIEKISILPFALSYKLYKTLLRSLGLLFSAALLAATLGTSEGAREFYLHRVSSLANDLADWVLFPFAVLTCFSKLIFASLVHPALYFRF